MIMNLSGFDNYENLVKGIDKSKMVQVQVTVKGKNGTFTRKQWKRASDVSSSDTVISKPDDPSTKTPKKQDTPAGNSKQRLAQMLGSHSRDEVMDFAKKNGVQWAEHSHVGINWMRASIAIQKHIDSNGDTWKSFEDGSQPQQSDPQKDGNPAQPDAKTDKADKTSDTDKKPQKTAKKQTKPDKPKVDKDGSKKLVEKLGKDETLEVMKAKGITWKESDHKGINWMRAMQALGKHLNDNPNGFDELVAAADNLRTKKDLQDTQKQVQNLQDLVSQLQNPTAQQMTQTAAKADILKGITTDTMSQYEKSHFGDSISGASPESLRNYRTLGMCAGDKESEEYLADLYTKYRDAVTGNSAATNSAATNSDIDADPLRNKLQGVVNKMVVGVVKSSLKNARKRSGEFTMQQKLMEPWIDPNTQLSNEQIDCIKNPKKHGDYNGQTGSLRQDACREKDGSHKLMHSVLDKFKLSKEYGTLAIEYDQILTELDGLLQNSPELQNCINGAGNGGKPFASAADAQKEIDRTINREKERLQNIVSHYEEQIKNPKQYSWTSVERYKDILKDTKKEIERLDSLTVTGQDLMKAFELRAQLFDPKFTDLNVNLYHHKMMASQLAYQYFINKDFVAEYPILSKDNLDKLDKADEDSLTNLALYAGMFKPSLTKGGKSAKDALMDKYAERQAILDAYGGVTAVGTGSQYSENNEIRCKVSKVSDKKAKEITDKIAADWDKQSHGRMKYRIKGVYEVSGLAAEKDFNKIKKQHSQYKGVKSGGKDCSSDLFYHGTGSMATSLILGHSGEFKIVKAKVGRMLGDGIYLADKSSKSAQYIGDAGYSRSGISGSLMVVEASLGDTLHRRTSQGYNHDTVFAGKTDGLLNNEWCVHDTHAVIPRYLVQMEIL